MRSDGQESRYHPTSPKGLDGTTLASTSHHLWYANGSNNELQTQLEIGRRVEIVTVDEAAALIADAEEIGRMLRGLESTTA